MRFRPARFWFSALLLVAFLSNELNAQTTTSGGLTGVVTDPSHALVPNANVEIRDTAKGTTQSTTTDREGVYRFFFLAPGRYTGGASFSSLGMPGTSNVRSVISKSQLGVSWKSLE
jgi:hypothetical protein